MLVFPSRLQVKSLSPDAINECTLVEQLKAISDILFTKLYFKALVRAYRLEN